MAPRNYNQGFLAFVFKQLSSRNFNIESRRLMLEAYLRWEVLDCRQKDAFAHRQVETAAEDPRFEGDLLPRLLTYLPSASLDDADSFNASQLFKRLDGGRLLLEKRQADRDALARLLSRGGPTGTPPPPPPPPREAVAAALTERFVVVGNEFAVETERGQFIPSEVAVCAFTVAAGVAMPTDCVHYFLKPDLPSGYLALAKEHAELTHQIPVNFGQFTLDFARTAAEVARLIASTALRDDDGGDAFVFCRAADYRPTRCLLDLLADDRAPFTPNLCCTEDLVSVLAECGRLDKSLADVKQALNRNTYDFSVGIRCAYHEEIDVLHCAKGTALRQVCHALDLLACASTRTEMMGRWRVKPTDVCAACFGRRRAMATQAAAAIGAGAMAVESGRGEEEEEEVACAMGDLLLAPPHSFDLMSHSTPVQLELEISRSSSTSAAETGELGADARLMPPSFFSADVKQPAYSPNEWAFGAPPAAQLPPPNNSLFLTGSGRGRGNPCLSGRQDDLTRPGIDARRVSTSKLMRR